MLRHRHSSKWLAVLTNQTAVSEPTCLKVSLRRESSEECAFKLLPRLTSRGEGEAVLYDDQVLVQSALITSVFLHYDPHDLNAAAERHSRSSSLAAARLMERHINVNGPLQRNQRNL